MRLWLHRLFGLHEWILNILFIKWCLGTAFARLTFEYVMRRIS